MFLDLRCLLDHANLFGILVCALFNIRLDWIFCMKVYIFLLHDFVVFAQFAADPIRFHSFDVSAYQSGFSQYVTVLLLYCMSVR